MSQLSDGFSLAVDGAKGKRLMKIQGLRFIDFALGDMRVMEKYAPDPHKMLMTYPHTSSADSDRHAKSIAGTLVELVAR
jgi:hypothetical protein